MPKHWLLPLPTIKLRKKNEKKWSLYSNYMLKELKFHCNNKKQVNDSDFNSINKTCQSKEP